MSSIDELRTALKEKKFHVVAQVAPALRVTIGEGFDYAPGTILTKKLVGTLKQAGFDAVFDTSVSADAVTVEEGTEFLHRIELKENLPLFTSCCCGSVAFIENNFPHLLNHFCTVKSPQQAMGALIKTYYAEKKGIKPEKIYSVSFMPCVVKKIEAKRPEMEFNGIKHVDLVVTTKELIQFFKEEGIDLRNAEEKDFDSLLGHATGAGQLFGATGGVMEAVLRFIANHFDSKIHAIEFRQVRGMQGFKEAEIKLNGKKIKVAVVNGLHNLKDLISNEEKFSKYDAIELMVCPGGCIGGGGQPKAGEETLEARRKALLKVDEKEKLKIASDNEEVKKLYEEFLDEPGSEKAKKILHTSFACLKCGVNPAKKE
ncbi:MAG: [Fe-Fe] hydrogenase large subunit C-terminal domain-containing protein [Candidatus Diapherotrites archaeon]